MQAAICVVSNTVSADRCAGQTYSCWSCVAAGSACGTDNAFLSNNGNCERRAFDQTDCIEECLEFCSGEGGSDDFLAYHAQFDDYIACTCLTSSAAADEPCRAARPSAVANPNPAIFNICTGARFSRTAAACISDACDAI